MVNSLVIEVEVHSALRDFLRFARKNAASLPPGLASQWPHHLTMARLVARAIRLGRPALIQTGISTGFTQARYRLSYLVSALLWEDLIILVTPKAIQERLLAVEIPHLQRWLKTNKPIAVIDFAENNNVLKRDFRGIVLASPDVWLADKLGQGGIFPKGIPTIIDGVDDLEAWAQEELTARIEPADWDELMRQCPDRADTIRDARVQLTKAIFQHPPNPYECCLVEAAEADILRSLYEELSPITASLPPRWSHFWHRWQTDAQLIWAAIARSKGQFSLYCAPVEVANALAPIWQQQPVVLIGGALDLDPEASVYRQQLGLKDLTYLKFSPDQQNELIQLYVPDRLPMPNTPEFQVVLMKQLRNWLLDLETRQLDNALCKRPVTILVGDVPLKAQVAATLAAEFGTRVQVEKTGLEDNGILVSGWEFWRQYQENLPTPQLLIVATLPIPSLENPLVAGRVAFYKEKHMDWFRLYLLPVALRELQRAIAPVREDRGVVAILDNRVNHRSYGQKVLSALSPLARINYADASWLREKF